MLGGPLGGPEEKTCAAELRSYTEAVIQQLFDATQQRCFAALRSSSTFRDGQSHPPSLPLEELSLSRRRNGHQTEYYGYSDYKVDHAHANSVPASRAVTAVAADSQPSPPPPAIP